MKKLFILLFIASTFSVTGYSLNYNYDVNGDGSVTATDITAIYDYLLGNVPPPDTHEYVDLGLPSGTLWAKTNVGASTPEEYGDYFAWGEIAPKDTYNEYDYLWYEAIEFGGDYLYMITKYSTDSDHGYNGFVDNKTELDAGDDAGHIHFFALAA